MTRSHGRASISARAPRALAICDRCNFQFNHDQLDWQYQWAGVKLQNIRLLVCKSCMDKPQEQLRTIILPPDPVPIQNPRPLGPTGYTNLINADSFSSWTTLNTTIVENAAVAPDGTMTAAALIENTANDFHTASLGISNLVTAGEVYTISMFQKPKGARNGVGFSGNASGASLSFIALNALANNPYSPAAFFFGGTQFIAETQFLQGQNDTFSNVPSGWWWLGYSFTATSNLTDITITLFDEIVNGTDFYQGDGVSGAYLWKPQLVKGRDNVWPGTTDGSQGRTQ